MSQLTAVIYEQLQPNRFCEKSFQIRHVKFDSAILPKAIAKPVVAGSIVVQQIISITLADNTVMHLYRDKTQSIELASLSSEHTMFMLKCS